MKDPSLSLRLDASPEVVGRRHLGEALARVHRDRIRMVYGEPLNAPAEAAGGGR